MLTAFPSPSPPNKLIKRFAPPANNQPSGYAGEGKASFTSLSGYIFKQYRTEKTGKIKSSPFIE